MFFSPQFIFCTARIVSPRREVSTIFARRKYRRMLIHDEYDHLLPNGKAAIVGKKLTNQ
jgi:hypothetical protein